MRILAIDTSSREVSVAILDGEKVVLELDSRQQGAADAPGSARLAAGSTDSLPPGYVKKRSKRGAKTSRVFPPGASVLLAPMVKSLFEKAGQTIDQIQLIAVASGPGSFTGLRVGVVTAKAFAYSTSAKILGVNTLELIAAKTADTFKTGAEQQPSPIRVVLNAQRQQLFCGTYMPGDSDWEVTGINDQPGDPAEGQTHSRIMDRDAFLAQLSDGDIVTGAGLKPVVDSIRANHPGVKIASQSCWDSSAADVGRLAWYQFQQGKRSDLWDLQPFYFRPSTAEEVRAANLNESR